MALRWSFDPPDPVGRLSGTEELRRVDRSTQVATGTLACPACDAPVAPGPSALAPVQREVTVLFTDVADFTAKTAELGS